MNVNVRYFCKLYLVHTQDQFILIINTNSMSTMFNLKDLPLPILDNKY